MYQQQAEADAKAKKDEKGDNPSASSGEAKKDDAKKTEDEVVEGEVEEEKKK